ncbi:MAG: hypothetical protein ACRDLR_03310 [Gaiellaceae bacterium]
MPRTPSKSAACAGAHLQLAIDHLRDLVQSDKTLAASEVARFEPVAGVRDDELRALEQFFSAVS